MSEQDSETLCNNTDIVLLSYRGCNWCL